MKQIAGLVVVVALVVAGPAHADEAADLAAASARYDAGKRAYDAADYAAAIADWQASYALSHASLLLFNLGQAYRLAGDCARANHYYQRYQQAEPTPPNPAELAAAMARCAGVAPLDDAAPVAPVVAVPPPAPVEVPSPEASGRPLRIAGLVTMGIGGVAVVASVVYGLSARDKAATIGDLPVGTPWTPELVALQQDGRAAAGRARLYGVVGALAVVGGATMWWLGRARGGVQVQLAVTPTRAEAVVACAF